MPYFLTHQSNFMVIRTKKSRLSKITRPSQLSNPSDLPCYILASTKTFDSTDQIPMMTSSSGNLFRVIGPLCGDSPVTGEFPSQRPVTRSFNVFFDLHTNKWLSKQLRRWWSEMASRSSWRHCNVSHWQGYKSPYLILPNEPPTHYHWANYRTKHQP